MCASFSDRESILGTARTVKNFIFAVCWCACLAVVSSFTSGVLLATSATPAAAQKSSIKINEKTKFYRISGKNAADFAISMSKRGPYSRAHRARAWATATRDMTYQVFHQKNKSNCKIKAVKVKLDVSYVMPKLYSTRGVSRREQSKWKKMYSLLNNHERKHGQFYKQFARKVYSTLRRMRSAKTCSQLENNAAKIVKKLAEEDKQRNVNFDKRDRRNYLVMERLYSGA